jgi:hypothetical protein
VNAHSTYFQRDTSGPRGSGPESGSRSIGTNTFGVAATRIARWPVRVTTLAADLRSIVEE